MHLTVSPQPDTEPATTHVATQTSSSRPWRLTGYAGKTVVHRSTCYGDRALDEAMRRLENDPAVTRITVAAA